MSTAAVSSNLVNLQSPGYFPQRRADLNQLSQDLKSGNLSAAKQDVTSIQTLGQTGPFSSGNAFGVAARQTDFTAISSAVQSGDIAGAQQALSQLNATFHTSASTLDPPPTSTSGSGSTAASPSSSSVSQSPGYFHQRRADLNQLAQDLATGNLYAAQQEASTIQTLGQTGPFASGNVFGVAARQTDFTAISSALQSGDLAGAQAALAQLNTTFHVSATLDPAPTSSSGSPPSSINVVG